VLPHKSRWQSHCWTRQSLPQEGCGAAQWVFAFFVAAQRPLAHSLLAVTIAAGRQKKKKKKWTNPNGLLNDTRTHKKIRRGYFVAQTYL
jgi:hypothetical protein